ncbi:TelA-like protein SA1238 [uncultured Clostridium sp.]|uniref:Toxic anion resistance protein n=1 Tax=Muricoprocola aceti TaxID=2981772 RepID=A0ABT2SI66_9FIRM|nr:toxic anion resistance protein [Muricoprocola aceti]MCI7225619.1 toxic anion resistance protein [Lachnospiraceae bacterium]MCQ4773546.1 toxic anion resistance protein [Lacrimispora saccharolytica]SCH05320.1 TelA-like protein SA1238 [uncultured Clostridium sp.]MCU6724180.1 toxic anion resistance protein [Muricoprocola aceti]MDD7436739.1 toxic anion resistance protein [Lachnospiraceae bacterium]
MSDEFEKLAGTAPTLTLTPFPEKKEELPQKTEEQAVAEVKEKMEEESRFTTEEQQQIQAFSQQINISDSNMILQYGAGAQQKLADFSEKALENVKSQDLGEVGNMLTDVVAELKNFDVDNEKKGFLGLFHKGENKLDAMKAKYDKTAVNVDKICDALEEHQVRLLKDTAMLDQMYDLNLTYYKELSMYIAAGKQKLEEVRSTQLKELMEKAQSGNDQVLAQEAKDLASYCDRFEKKLHDLELSRMISMQTAPQIRLIQNNNTMMVEKIQSTLVNTIPLWKNQMVIALGLEHAQRAAKAQNAVTDMTNELLKKNANALHEATVSTAKASERGIVDIETLTQTNAELVKTFDEVLQIQSEGRQKRLQAEADMVRMENELKQKLLEIRK